jgi:N-methylhydantoinase A
MRKAIRIGVDIGGTFTDVALEDGRQCVTAKVLTTPEAAENGVLAALDEATRRAGVEPPEVGLIIHGTTLATNALIERSGARTALLTTEGFRDVLEMGTESRFEQYDLGMQKPPPLIPRRHRFVVRERVGADGRVLRPLEAADLEALVPRIEAAGSESLAIAFLHSFAHPDHEELAAEVLSRALPGLWLSLSSQVSPEIREYERFSTTAANAYVQPLVAGYLERLRHGLDAAGFAAPLFLMLSSGGVCELETARRFPVRLVESGPAGGAILAADVARQCGFHEVVSFDMGGTTAKICLVDEARPQMSRDMEVAREYRFKAGSGLPLRIPVIEMVEIGAGGGSIARLDALQRIQVGPQSAGAEPGPASYGRGGSQPTVTDANVELGRIDPMHFAGGTMVLDAEAASAALKSGLASLGDPLSAAFGIAEIVDENMANAAREHAVERGKSLAGRTLIAFGGSAPIHAARLAEKLGIARIVVPLAAGVGSAIGFLRAPVAFQVARTNYQRLGSLDAAALNAMFAAMSSESRAVVARGAPGARPAEARFGYMRYVGQGHEIAVEVPAGELGDGAGELLRQAYDRAYLVRYGRLMEGVDIEVMSWGLELVAAGSASPPAQPVAPLAPPDADHKRQLFAGAAGAFSAVPVYLRHQLAPGMELSGPAVIVEDQTTTVVTAAFTAGLNSAGHIVLERRSPA